MVSKGMLQHELLHIGQSEKGTFIVKPHDVEDFREIIDEYGLDWSQ